MITSTIKLKAPVYIAAAAALTFGVCLFTQGASGSGGAYDGLILCGEVIIPSLFPFMVLAAFISKSDVSLLLSRLLSPFARLFRLPKEAGLPLFLSFVGGYPIGGASAARLCSAGDLNQQDAFRMLCFAVCGGPAFIIKAVGEGMLGSTKAGVLLLAAHISAAMIIGMFSGIFSKKVRDQSVCDNHPTGEKKRVTDAFVESVYDSCLSMFSICGFVIIFSSILAIIASFDPPPALKTALGCILEVTTGCSTAASTGSLAFIAAVLGFGGLSVCFQVFSAARKIKINIPVFFLYRLLHAALSALIIIPLEKLFPIDISVFASTDAPLLASGSSATAPASLALIFMSVVFLCSTSRGRLVLRRKM